MIFGGWDDDFLHGGSGDDAIGGGEALTSPTSSTSAQAQPDGLIRTDWTRPYNPGNLLLFGADVDPWNAPKPFVVRLGEFYLYDEYDARRAILFGADRREVELRGVLQQRPHVHLRAAGAERAVPAEPVGDRGPRGHRLQRCTPTTARASGPGRRTATATT